jgi:hypothetical protein
MMLWTDQIPAEEPATTVVRVILASLALGLAAGMVREKSHSLLPGILFQVLAMLLVIFYSGNLF